MHDSLQAPGVAGALAVAAALPDDRLEGLQFLKAAAARCTSLEGVGRAMLWLLVHADELGSVGADGRALVTTVLGPMRREFAMHRGRGCTPRPLFPLPLGSLASVLNCAKEKSLGAFCSQHEGANFDEEVWLALSACAANGVAGRNRAPMLSQPNTLQKSALAALLASVKRALADPVRLERSPRDAEKELSERFLSYTGEEVPKMQIITVKQVESALPPASHSGSIDALELLCDGSRKFLEHPEESLLDTIPPHSKLQAKVHIKKGDEMALAKLLVDRKICVWVPRGEVLHYQDRPILNGLFAVGKGTRLESGEESQRLIMNLVPTNSAFRHARGSMVDLPGITQYLSLVATQSDQLYFYQSDMSAAFYLFRILDVGIG